MTVKKQTENIQREKVGGKYLTFTSEFARPANTTAYTAGDVVSNSATATTLLVFGGQGANEGSDDFPVSLPGGSALLVKAIIETDLKTETAQMDLVLYDASEATVTVPADNAPDTSLYANRSHNLGTISFPSLAEAADTTNSTGARAQWTGTPLAVVAASGAKQFYGKLVNKTGTTPASGQNFSVKLTFLVN